MTAMAFPFARCGQRLGKGPVADEQDPWVSGTGGGIGVAVARLLRRLAGPPPIKARAAGQLGQLLLGLRGGLKGWRGAGLGHYARVRGRGRQWAGLPAEAG